MELFSLCEKATDEVYQSELKRQQSVINKTDFLFRWLTMIVSIFNISLPLIVKQVNININDKKFVLLYTLLMIILLCDMGLTICVNYPIKYKSDMMGSDWLKFIKDNPDKISNEMDFRYYHILTTDIVSKRLRDNNDRAFKIIRIAYIILIVALGIMALFFSYIIWRK